MTLSDQLAPVLTLAKRKGVEVVPGWLRISKRGAFNHRDYGTWFSAETSESIITGSLSAWLAGQGIAVTSVLPPFDIKAKWSVSGMMVPCPQNASGYSTYLRGTDSYLSALLAAATARLGEMPSSAPASKEHP